MMEKLMVSLPRVTLNQLGRILVGGCPGCPVCGDAPFPAPSPTAYRGNELLVYHIVYHVYLFSLAFLTPYPGLIWQYLKNSIHFFFPFKLLCFVTNRKSLLLAQTPWVESFPRLPPCQISVAGAEWSLELLTRWHAADEFKEHTMPLLVFANSQNGSWNLLMVSYL